jgi:hypothetical protein
MFTVQGIYDGHEVKITEQVPEKKYKVIVTFLEEIQTEDEKVREFASKTESFDFWENAAEDVYQDYLISKPDKK